MASDNDDILKTVARHVAEANSTDDAIRQPAMFRLALLRRVLNNTSDTNDGRRQSAFASVANDANPDLATEDRSSSDPPYSTLEDKSNPGAAAGDSARLPSAGPNKLQSTTAPKAKRKLPTLTVKGLDPYVDGKWTALDWLEHVWDRSNVKQIDILCRLGLVAPGVSVKNYQGIFEFEDPVLTELSHAIHKLSKTFHDERFDRSPVVGRGRRTRNLHDEGRNAFIEAACNPLHMIHDLNDLLFDKFGSKIWGMNVPSREGCTYRLELENDDDRPNIEALIHLWVFVKIANKCRDKHMKLSRELKEAKATGEALTSHCSAHNGNNDEYIDAEMSGIVGPMASKHEDLVREADDTEAVPTAAEDEEDSRVVCRMKRKHDAKETTSPVAIGEDTDDEDVVKAPFQKKRRTSRQKTQDNDHVMESDEMMDIVCVDDLT